MTYSAQQKKHRYGRELITVLFEEHVSFTEVYGQSHGRVLLECHLLRRENKPSKTLFVFMHPTGTMHYLPMPRALAAAGCHVLSAASRYPNNDSALIMEKVIVDLGACIRHAREKLGYETIILCGWSGGGSLSMTYQSQAEDPTITSTPAGDPPDLTKAGLIPAAAILQLAAHTGRAQTLTEWLDASIRDELNPSDRDPELDLYNPGNPNQPPYSREFQERYAQAQIARNRRITDWVRNELDEIQKRADGTVERGFVVHGTMAAPCWLDTTIDANERLPGSCFLGDPRAANNGPAGIARFCTLRSWLSQWSYDLSNANGLVHAARIKAPALVIGNTADDACLPSQTNRIFNAIGHDDKEMHLIKGATHYYVGQPDKLDEAVAIILDWLKRKDIFDIETD